ncbi:hypothetical protein AB0L65_22710 [Nonomuraea sp. NPDC052116]|uniref:hypothetical protein n=1 Tax=Nonomuraea sp. NPDC052116 TaxID=3155665 RepID=UPI00341A6C35
MLADVHVNTAAGLDQGITRVAPKVLARAAGIAGQLTKAFTPELVATLAPGMVPGAYGNHTTVYVTNNYLVGEPTSKTANKGLPYASVLGLA